MELIDLRSDTVTQPTAAMRKAMAEAEVGDDVFGEDPTINRLQEMAAAKMGKEAGLFVPSGTMGNLISVLTHCGRGDEVILGNGCHTHIYEAGGISALGGVHPFAIPNQLDGTLALGDIKNAIRTDNIHFPPTRLIMLENTHNRCGGVPVSLEYTRAVGEIAQQANLMLHIDGARIFNAAAVEGVEARLLVEPADSVTFCLSKGLCAPVGSVICGTKVFIDKARRIRKQLGGGMRQAGVLAAGGIVALEQMVDRISEDHVRAKNLATALGSMKGIRLDYGMPATNMIFMSFDEKIPLTISQVLGGLKQQGVLVTSTSGRQIRLVTHYWIKASNEKQVIQAFQNVLKI